MCGDSGWTLDSNPSREPQMLELIPCLLPDCAFSGRPVGRVSFPFSEFDEVARHPATNNIMSVGRWDA